MAIKAFITDREMQARPAAQDIWLIESASRGAGRLNGRITPAGERRFYFRYVDSKGKQVRLLIGPYSSNGDGKATFTVQQARDRANELSLLYRGTTGTTKTAAVPGIKDLREYFAQRDADAIQSEQDARRAADLARQKAEEDAKRIAAERERRISIRALFDRWRDVDLQPGRKADGTRTGRKDGGLYTEQMFGRYVFQTIGDRAAIDVQRYDLMAILDAVKASGKLRTANVLLANLRQMFDFALTRDIVPRNPLDTVKKRNMGGKEVERDRVLTVDEIALLHRQIPESGLNQRSACAVWLLLATGARVGELMGATWAGFETDIQKLAQDKAAHDVKVGAVDLVGRRWHLPTTKNEREHTIHLSDFALAQFAILATLREADSTGRATPWVFPNSNCSGPVCVKSFGKQLADRQRPPEKRMSGRSKNTEALMLPGGRWTAHDLRRTAGTLMASLGISGDVIDECLNHVIESRVRRTYIRDRRPTEQARAFDALGVRLREIISGQKTSNVVPLRSA